MPNSPEDPLFLPDGIEAQGTYPESDCQTPIFNLVDWQGLHFRRAPAVLPTCSPASTLEEVSPTLRKSVRFQDDPWTEKRELC